MKRLIYLFISIVISITLISAIQINSGKTKILTLQSVDKNAGLLKQSADVISTRLKLFGLNSAEVKTLPDKGQIEVILPENTVISEIEVLLTSKGELSFYETFTHEEILSLFKSDNQLFQLLKGQGKANISDPRAGCTDSEGKVRTNEYLSSASQVKNCKLLWGNKSEKSGYCLFALKTNEAGNPLLVRSDIESVKIVSGKDPQDLKIQIKLNPSATKVFADATGRNLNKSIAIVIDNQVYSWPVVRSVIKEGEIEVTGDFTKNEVNYFPAVFNSPQLPIELRLMK